MLLQKLLLLPVEPGGHGRVVGGAPTAPAPAAHAVVVVAGVAVGEPDGVVREAAVVADLQGLAVAHLAEGAQVAPVRGRGGVASAAAPAAPAKEVEHAQEALAESERGMESD